MKFGFDVHGVIDDLPETFVELCKALYDAGHEIHILTGSHASQQIFDDLERMGIKWHKFFSIADHHKERGTKMWADKENGTPWIDKVEWDKTKADYCEREGIHLHFDDTPEYEQYFRTPFVRVWTKNNRNGRGKRPDRQFITNATLNAVGFIFTDKEAETRQSAWVHSKETNGRSAFIYWPHDNILQNWNGEAITRPTNMADIKRFMEIYEEK